MKINKISIILLSILLLFAIIIAGILLWFFSPGVQHLFNLVHMDTSMTGYIFDENDELIREAELCVKVNSFPPSSKAEQGNISLFELTGFSTLTSDDVVGVYTQELKNDILMVDIIKPGAYKKADGTYAPSYGDEYRIFIDKKTSEILMCIIQISNHAEVETFVKYYFVPTEDTSRITDTLNRAYID